MGCPVRKYLEEEEVRSLVYAPKRLRDHLILRLLYQTGMRVGELAELSLGDVDFQREELSIQRAKNHAEGRKVPLVDRVTVSLLKHYLGTRQDRRGPLFLSNKGSPLSKRQIQRLVTDYALEIGLDREKCHAHILRHTHAVHALRAGIDLRTLQQNLGHASLNVTAVYLTLDIEDRKRAYRERPLPNLDQGDERSYSWTIYRDHPLPVQLS